MNKIFELYPHLNTKVHLVGNSAAGMVTKPNSLVVVDGCLWQAVLAVLPPSASVVATVGARIAKAAVPKIHLVGVLMTSGAIDPYTA